MKQEKKHSHINNEVQETEGSFESGVIDAEEIVARSEALSESSRMDEKSGKEEARCCRYKKLQTVLGEGTFKRVYKAVDQEEGKEVAWNEIRIGEKGYEVREKAAFANEITLLKSISHPNILRIFDHWFADDKFIFITELMTGGTLRQYIAEIGDLNTKLIKKWGRHIVEGLVYLHSQDPPIIHRDIKCENIFVNATLGEVKIGDLGVAKERRMKRYTVVGTPQFMAREMFEGDGYCEKIDVYAFGMCLIEMATGMYPYKEYLTAAEVYKAIIQGVPPVILSSIKDVCLRNLIMNCLVAEKDRLRSVDCLRHHFFDNENTCCGECIPAECMAVTPLTAPANDMEISLLSFRNDVITFQLFFMSMARFIKFDYNLTYDTVESVANEMLEEDVVSVDQKDSLLKLLSRGIERAREKAVELLNDERSGEDSSLLVIDDSGNNKFDGDLEKSVDEIHIEEKKSNTTVIKNDFNQIADRLSIEDAESVQELDSKNSIEAQVAKPIRSSHPDVGMNAISSSPVRNLQGSPRGASLELSPGMYGSEAGVEEQKRIAASKYFDGLECPIKKYDNDMPIEEFSIDVSIATKRSPDAATNWIKTFKSNDIDTVFELKVLVDEDWDKLGLTVFSSRAMKNMLYGIDKIPLKEKQLPTNTVIKDYDGMTEINVFLTEIASLINKEKCVSVWESKLLAQDLRTVEELRSLHQDDWDRLGLSVYSCRVIKNVIFKKGKITFH